MGYGAKELGNIDLYIGCRYMELIGRDQIYGMGMGKGREIGRRLGM